MLSAMYKYSPVILFFIYSITTRTVGDPIADINAAISNNNMNIVKRLLIEDANDTLIKKQGRQIASTAAEKGNLFIIEYIAERNPSVFKGRDEKNQTVAHIAAEYGHPNIVEYLLQNKYFHPITQDKYPYRVIDPLLHIAAEKGYLKVIDYMWCYSLSNNIDDMVSIGNLAAGNGHLDVACYVTIAGANRVYCKEFSNIIKTAIQKSKKRDNKTLELILKVAAKWEELGYCSNIVELAFRANDRKLVHFLAENQCTHFLSPKGYTASEAMEIAFQENLVNKKFLQCLDKKGKLLKLVDKSLENTICHIAAKYGRLDVIQFIAEKNSSILDKCNAYGKTVFDIADEGKKQTDILRYIVTKNPWCRVKKKGRFFDPWYPKYTTALHEAIARNIINMKTLKNLVENKQVSITKTNDLNETVAHVAANKGNMKILQYLVEKQPSILTIADYWGNTVLHTLAAKNILTVKALEYFLDKGAPLIVRNNHHSTAAHNVANNGNIEILQHMVEKEPFLLNIKDDNDDTVLHILAEKNVLSMSSLKYFVDKGAPLTLRNKRKNTVAHLVATHGHTALVQYLVEKKPSTLSIVDGNGDTILHVLAKMNTLSIESLTFFVDKGFSSFLTPSINGQDSIGLIAAKNGNLGVLMFIATKEPLFAGNGSVGLEISKIAAIHGHSSILKFIAQNYTAFLAQRPDIFFKLPNSSVVLGTLKFLKAMCETHINNWDSQHFENGVLHQAIEHDYPNILKDMKYNVNLVSNLGEPLIFTAMHRQKSSIFHYLATHTETDLTVLDHEGNNILFVAAQICDLEKMKYILDKLKIPLDIEWRNNIGNTVLHVAVHKVLAQAEKAHNSKENYSNYNSWKEYPGPPSMVQYLIEQKHANVNSCGHENKTVLHCAMSSMRYDVANYLLDHGANPKLRDASGHSALQIMHFPIPEKMSY